MLPDCPVCLFSSRSPLVSRAVLRRPAAMRLFLTSFSRRLRLRRVRRRTSPPGGVASPGIPPRKYDPTGRRKCRRPRRRHPDPLPRADSIFPSVPRPRCEAGLPRGPLRWGALGQANSPSQVAIRIEKPRGMWATSSPANPRGQRQLPSPAPVPAGVVPTLTPGNEPFPPRLPETLNEQRQASGGAGNESFKRRGGKRTWRMHEPADAAETRSIEIESTGAIA